MSKSGRPREFKDTAVIDAAVEVFWDNGYEACSTEALCSKTGLGRGSLYNAFGSKHELYEQALQRYHELGIREQMDILEKEGPIRDRLRALLEWEIHEDSKSKNRGCLLINAASERSKTDPAVERIFKQHVDLLEHAIEKTIKTGQETGEIPRNREASELADMFLSSYYGLRVIYPATLNRGLAERIIQGTLSSIF
ncbi:MULTISPECIES: TetR/AcrR family transcriptional regulator [Paenibacillus]|uniref:TetR family transcriptional regulator n=1 Tax=Paenibacillus albilobatus TaxID=2716884 RepID=A0A919XBJ8_9BACL|nr:MULTISPECIES: TetR/AcrR family transcriptional regulator [Paenibacillus]MDR9855084.1 TetR/AcrR family transcriptional regulator [Paenibacillus sp. VCA1]GIO29449.1 TetR family transcriptional regulator [Paenibacillus albilobatus]